MPCGPDGVATPVVLNLNRPDERASHDIDLFHAGVNAIVPWPASLPAPWSWSHWNRFFHHAVSNLVICISLRLSKHVVAQRWASRGPCSTNKLLRCHLAFLNMNSNAIDVPPLPAMKSYYPSIGKTCGEVCAVLISIWSICPLVRVECE
uniref:Uncharacterized protein n=1 Tax=Arundo donax TaxID=35708 RepID=A0A0A9BJT7_ARUDO